MRNILAFVLGGGKGTRLHPLTKYRSKPAVPLAGNYRLIDIPISNCLHSQINRIYVLTQFNSVSLHRHITNTYKFDPFSGGFVDILAAQQTPDGIGWYQGTADAVRQHLRFVQESSVDYVAILSGDQLYRMDFRLMLEAHKKANADVSIAVLPVDRKQAQAFGILRLDANGYVAGFLEKPKTNDEMDLVRTDPAWIDAQGIASRGRDLLGSMGIYIFNRDTLIEVLSKTDYQDFGKEVFPATCRTKKVSTYLFDGYWEDIGTIRAFFETNLQLASMNPPFEFAHRNWPIFTRMRYLPPAMIEGATIKNSLITDGCSIESGSIIENSVIGLRCRIGRNCQIRNTILMGADYFQSAEQLQHDRDSGRPVVGIGDGSIIDGAIVDKNCRIGKNVVIRNTRNIDFSLESEPAVIADGIVVLPKETIVRDGYTME